MEQYCENTYCDYASQLAKDLDRYFIDLDETFDYRSIEFNFLIQANTRKYGNTEEGKCFQIIKMPFQYSVISKLEWRFLVLCNLNKSGSILILKCQVCIWFFLPSYLIPICLICNFKNKKVDFKVSAWKLWEKLLIMLLLWLKGKKDKFYWTMIIWERSIQNSKSNTFTEE